MKALCFNKFGGPEVLEYIDVPNPVLQKNQVLVQMQVIGLNYADIYRRNGNYHLLGQPPFIAGYEGAGVIVDTNNITTVNIGDRVCFADMPYANAALVAVDLQKLIPVPNNIDIDIAASIMLQGLTAQYLVTDSYQVQLNQTVLIHACAGGVGQFLTQLCKLKGAAVIGLTSSDAKAHIAKQYGADEVFLYNDNWMEAIKKITPQGVDVVYDSVGTTINQSIAAAKECGAVVFFGFAGGNPPAIDPRVLMDGSKRIIGGDLWSYLTTHEERKRRSQILFDWIANKQIIIAKPTSFALSDGAAAHRLLESRKSTGKIILIP